MDASTLINLDLRSTRSQSVGTKHSSLIQRVIPFRLCPHCHASIACEEYEEHLETCTRPERSPACPAVLESFDLTEEGTSPGTDANEQSQDELDMPEDSEQRAAEHKSSESETDRSNDSYVLIPTPEVPRDSPIPHHFTTTQLETDLADAEVEAFPLLQKETLSSPDDNGSEVFTTPRISPVTFVDHAKKCCPICSCLIEEVDFQEHIENCLEEGPITPMHNSELATHVSRCGMEQTTTCSACEREIDLADNMFRKSSCPSEHIYCLSCLQHSMGNYARNQSIPLCHPTLCDYPFSRYEILFIPLERRIADRVLSLVAVERAAQCPTCRCEIEVHDDDELYEHIDRCRAAV